LQPSDAAKLRAADRALHRKAPCQHENKNGMADALLFETYVDLVQAAPPGERLAFVTHNKSDFGAQNQRIPHADIAAAFSKVKSLYFINLAELLRRIEPSMVSELVWSSPGNRSRAACTRCSRQKTCCFIRCGSTVT
jgi:hypothetical protein